MGHAADEAPPPPYTPTPAEDILIAALRSGRYPQAASALRTRTGYCCLGVACDVYHKLTGKLGWVEVPGQDIAAFSFGLREVEGEEPTPQINSLPPEVQAWLGWNDNEGRLKVNNNRLLSGLNDSGTPFEEIALLIEQGKVERA